MQLELFDIRVYNHRPSVEIAILRKRDKLLARRGHVLTHNQQLDVRYLSMLERGRMAARYQPAIMERLLNRRS